jgi:uncharacterized protein (DUF58 family)
VTFSTTTRTDSGPRSTRPRRPASARPEIVDESPPRLVGAGIALVTGARTARESIARFWEQVTGLVTPAGWMVGIWAVFGLVVGTVWGWAEFLIGGTVAVILLVFAIPFLAGRAPYEVFVTLEHDAVVVGNDAEGVIVARNAQARLALPGRIEVPVGAGVIAFHVPLLRRGSERRENMVIPAKRRGIVDVGPATTTRSDPLRLLQREFRWADVRTLYIHPATIAIPSTSLGLIRDLEGRSTRTVTSEDISFHAVREYTPGDARRHVHWKSTAKTGTLMVRQFEETRRSTISVILDLDEASYGTEAEFEMAVSAVGSLGVRAVRDGRDVQVAVSGEVPEFARTSVRSLRRLKVTSARALLDELSGVEVGSTVIPLPTVTRMVNDTTPNTSLVFMVTGSATTVSQMQSASLAFRPEVAVAAVVCDPESEPSIHAVGPLRVLSLGVLDDLRDLLSRGATE